VYGEADMKRAEAALRRAALIAGALGAAALLMTALGLILRIKAFAIAAAAVGGGAVYGWIALKLVPWSAYVKFLREMAQGLKRETCGAVVSLSDETRLADGVVVRDLMLDAGADSDLLFYWDEEKPRPDLAPGARVRITSFGKFVTALEPLESWSPEGG